jgi:GT2 family glycosyltransferase
MISVIIPTYQSPDALNLCLQSAINGQQNKNQIIVVVDGFYELNKKVLEKYSEYIDVLNLEENVGTPRATNLGVYNALGDKILIANDDNVFPLSWDIHLEEDYIENSVLSPNQIEPYPSMFSQFHIKDLGKSVDTFNLERFQEYEKDLNEVTYKKTVDETGSTLPIFMSKMDYLKLGSWDETYPGGWVVDWDFFLKCQLSGLKMLRTYKCHFYHFVSLSIKTQEQMNVAKVKEQQCHEYAKYKWGNHIQHNPSNNLKFI